MATLEQFKDSAQAMMLRDVLKGHGIRATIKGQAGLMGSGARLAGGFLVQVPPGELAEARKVLEQLAAAAEEAPEEAPALPHVPGTCPHCRSANVARVETPAAFRLILTILLLGLPLLFPAPRTWQCRDCEQHWTE